MAKQSKPWTDRWKIEKELNGGGQCDNFLVTSINDVVPGKFVLKVIKDATMLERRTRFYREIHSYIALKHPFVPQIVDHNCDETPDVEKRLFFVYPYIEGVNLEEKIDAEGPLSLDEAIQFVLKMTDILIACHELGIVHRDIKPDNIILKDGRVAEPRLIDFGLSAMEADEVLNESGVMQLGNRFLYLPELKHNNGNKRDKRSDITYLVGILFYLLTSKYPSHFLDEEGRYPHQRVDFESLIEGTAKVKINLLRQLFDRGFQVQLNNRFQDINGLTDLLNKLRDIKDEEKIDYKTLIMSAADLSKGKVEVVLQAMYGRLKQIFAAFPARNKFPNVSIGISGPSVLPHWDPICIAGHYYLTEKFKGKIKRSYMFKVYPNGADYILSIIIGQEEKIIQRFQSVADLVDDTVLESMEDIIWPDFATVLTKESE
ncbi:serine/threonine-protein kinase [Mucilaginibacter sp. NFX135]|uniref:serine/threonine-protein kinase n=1 Tax=Mucilaginibacter sp. NFX135 TaxID=3402687 RepID=UPI003AFAE1BF